MADYELVFARCDLCRVDGACARVDSPGMSDVCIDICLDCARAIFHFIAAQRSQPENENENAISAR